MFLDEISELPLAAQVKLLRSLQQGEVEPVGGRKPVKVDVRIVSATNRNLLNHVKAGHFREDLFYRLHVLPLTIPPLRARLEDIPHLVRHFVARFSAEENRRITGISGEAMALLGRAPWPGNVRQLENAVYRAVVMSDSDQLGINDFPQAGTMQWDSAASPAEPLALHPEPAALTELVTGADIPIAPAPTGNQFPSSSSSYGTLTMIGDDGEVRPLADIEAETIRFAISHYRGQMSEVARRLKIGRSTLYRKLDETAASGGAASDQDH